MTDDTDTRDRLDRLESLVERQGATIDAQRERIAELEADGASDGPSVSRRTALKAGGLLALFGLGSATASADPQGQVGTVADPLKALYTLEANSPSSLALSTAGARTLELGAPETDASGDTVGGNVVAGHADNAVSDAAGVVIGGGGRDGATNTVGGDCATIGGGQGNDASARGSTVGGGTGNAASDTHATIAGGIDNASSGGRATVGGGRENTAGADLATVGGGSSNAATAIWATVTGGWLNEATGDHATVGGGRQNATGGEYGTVGGGYDNVASGQYGTVGGGGSNGTSARGATVAGGIANDATNENASVGGGGDNAASGTSATVGGGNGNGASANSATVGGGAGNAASGQHATVAGGKGNAANNLRATVGGGDGNTASGDDATVGGGRDNLASGIGATVPGGAENTADGTNSFTAGFRASASGQNGVFVWGDSTNESVSASSLNQFVVQADNGVYIGTDGGPDGQIWGNGRLIETSTGGYLNQGGAWVDSSSRAVKDGIEPVDPGRVLDRVTSLPVCEWSYEAEPDGVRHVGPMAEDFHATFGLGADDESIASMDTAGVALAAIKGLAQKHDERIDDLDAALDEKDARIEDLEDHLGAREDAGTAGRGGVGRPGPTGADEGDGVALAAMTGLAARLGAIADRLVTLAGTPDEGAPRDRDAGGAGGG